MSSYEMDILGNVLNYDQLLNCEIVECIKVRKSSSVLGKNDYKKERAVSALVLAFHEFRALHKTCIYLFCI